MSWQNEARSRSANAVFHKHKDLVAQGADVAAAASDGSLAPTAASYMLQQPMHMPVHRPPVPMSHMAGHIPVVLPPQMMQMQAPMYPGGPMGLPPPG